MPPRIVGTFHSGITVASLDRALAFYCDLLGLRLLWRRTYAERYIFRLAGVPNATSVDVALLEEAGSRHRIEILEYRGVEASSASGAASDCGSAHLGFVVDDIDGFIRRLRDAGVRLLAAEPISIEAGPNVGARGLYVRDPDGFLIELHEVSAEKRADDDGKRARRHRAEDVR